MRVGIIEIPQELLLKFLQYPDGNIRSVEIPIDRAGVIRIQLEHPEMPEVREGEHLIVVTPAYIKYEDCLGHRVSIREKRR